MRNLKPVYILLGGSSIIGAMVLIVLLIVNTIIELPIWLNIGLPVFITLLTYLTFYIFIRAFITEKLRVLYRSIRKGKFDADTKIDVRFSEDVIEKAEEETKEWTEAKINEISRLKEQASFRREFLGNLAHELKTPVFSIQGYILTLLEGGLEDESINRKFLERASKSTERMTSILDDLDQLSQLEVNEFKLDYTNFDIKELVSEIFDDLEQKSKKKGVTLQFSKKFDSIVVSGDRNRIGQVLTNLIGNSITYGHEGGVTDVRFYILDDIITIEVSDNGPGIPEDSIPRLFERFYRVEKSRNRNEGGSGLGLAIVKHIVESHGQSISVRSTVGKGSTFTFSLDKGY